MMVVPVRQPAVGDVAVHLTVGPRPPDVWVDLLGRAAEVSFLHEELWTRALSAHAGVEGIWLVAGADRPVAGLAFTRRRRGPLQSWECHYLGNACAPLLADDVSRKLQERSVAALLEAVAELGRSPRCLGLTWTLPPTWDERLGPELNRLGLRRRPVETALMPLAGGIDHVESKIFKLNRRNERNRSLKAGCVAEITRDPAALDDIHSLYLDAAKRWGIDPLPQALLHELLLEGAGKVFLAIVRFEGRVVGGHLCWHDRDTVTAWVGATDPDHNDKFVATLIVWEELCEACRRGAAWLDLGGDGGQPGVRKFKSLLGARFVERGCWELAPSSSRILKAITSRLKRRGGA